MKQLITIIFAFFLLTRLNATTITALVNNGKWSVSSSWSPARQPTNGDTILIPAGLNLKVDANENLNNVVVIVRGMLTFTNGKLRLDALSKVIVDFGGTIDGGGNNDQISIAGVFKYRGTDPPVIGYAVADTTTGNGFGLFGVLPFRFISFTASISSTGTQLNWTYNFSPNSRYFDVQGSVDGKRWETKSRITAKDNGGDLQQYSTSINSAVEVTTYYRIVQVDNNGSALYSEVRSVTGKNNSAGKSDIPKAYIFGNILMVDFPVAIVGSAVIRVINTNGQVIRQKQYEGVHGQLSMSVSNELHGIHIVQIIQANNKVTSTRLMF